MYEVFTNMKESREPVHRSSGIPLGEWIALIRNELRQDAVGLWQVVRSLRLGFGLTGSELTQAVRAAVKELLKSGAVPVQGNEVSRHWELRRDLMAPDECGVDLIVKHWQELGRDPDVGDIWFAFLSDVG